MAHNMAVLEDCTSCRNGRVDRAVGFSATDPKYREIPI